MLEYVKKIRNSTCGLVSLNASITLTGGEDINFFNMFGLAILDKDSIDRLKSAGCIEIVYVLETI